MEYSPPNYSASTDAKPHPQAYQQQPQVYPQQPQGYPQQPQAYSQPQGYQQQPQQQHTFPSQLTLTQGISSHGDIVLVSPAQSFHVSTHGSLSSQPSIVLHSGASSSTPPLATADNGTISHSTDIRIFSRATNQPVLVTKMSRGGLFKGKTEATLDLSGVGSFEWRTEGGVMGIGANKVLVGGGAGEVLVKYTTHAKFASKDRGTIEFMQGSREQFGGVWEVLAVVSLLAVVDKDRKTMTNVAVLGAA